MRNKFYIVLYYLLIFFIIANKHATLHLQLFINYFVLYNESYQLTLLVILVPRRYIEEETRFPGISFYICQFSLLIITESREGKHSF